MSLDYKSLINKVKEWDGFTWVVLPLLYLEKFVKLVASAETSEVALIAPAVG